MNKVIKLPKQLHENSKNVPQSTDETWKVGLIDEVIDMT